MGWDSTNGYDDKSPELGRGLKQRGGTRKVAEVPHDNGCRHKKHYPPLPVSPGFFQYTCPHCSATIHFTVR